ncbi:hypothetical protein AMEX_G11616 [Astyanax mexicanus]|uniref:Uncharacterized protein n=1 Tax=Astyanax mexicanus TaxID=7994 RepID=A0A8T2LXZ0_ASTMX|nr:hypothetical protein AMEX_G11616 [Astyanax mexicanus]
MYFLHPIVEEDETESFFQRALSGQVSRVQSPQHELRSSKHFIGYEDHEAAPIQSEAQESSGRQKRLGSFRSSSSLAEITMRVQNDLRKEQDEPARRQRSSTQRLSRSSSEIASPLVVQMVPRGRSVGGTSDPVQRTSKKAKNEPLLPQWLINLMFDIEEATKHELTVE